MPTYRESDGRDVPIERTFEAMMEIENKEGLLRPGMSVRGKIYAGTRPLGTFGLADSARPREPRLPPLTLMLSIARRAAVLLLCLPASVRAAELPRGLDIEGMRDVQKLTLGQAIEMVLENNLEVEFNKVDVKIEEARRRFAAGVFDPTLNASVSRESLQRPDITTNITQAESLLQTAQIRAIEENTRQLQILNNQPITPFTNFETGRIVVFDQDADRAETSVGFRTPLGTRAALRRGKRRFAAPSREIPGRPTFLPGVRRDRNPSAVAQGFRSCGKPCGRAGRPDQPARRGNGLGEKASAMRSRRCSAIISTCSLRKRTCG